MIRAFAIAAAGVALASGVSFAAGWRVGGQRVQAKWDLAQAAQRIAVTDAVQRALDVGQAVVTQYVDRVQVVMTQGATVIQKVPVYVTREADTRCIVPRGFVWLLDSAATGRELPGATAGAADAAAGLALSAVASTVSTNYTTCRATAARLIALQDWARQVSGSE